MFTPLRLPQWLISCAALGVFVASAQAATPSPAPEALKPLLETLNERLNIGDLVALTKWDSGKPVQDSTREAQVIFQVRAEATYLRLDLEDISQFVTAQMEANKLVQYGLLAEWQAAGRAPDTPRPDLVKQIRPRLNELQNRLLKQYIDFLPYRQDPHCVDWLTEARAHLTQDRLHELALIRATGELCTADLPRA